MTVCPDNEKKNEVISIHRISKAASETNFIKGGNIIRKVYFYPKKPQILILTQTDALWEAVLLSVVKTYEWRSKPASFDQSQAEKTYVERYVIPCPFITVH